MDTTSNKKLPLTELSQPHIYVCQEKISIIIRIPYSLWSVDVRNKVTHLTKVRTIQTNLHTRKIVF